MKIILYKGYHSAEAYHIFKECFDSEILLIYLPPSLNDYSFTEFLPKGDIEAKGELWSGDEKFQTPRNHELQPGIGVFSSGTTAQSKLVLYSKENLDSSTKEIYSLFDQDRLKKIFCYPQPFHTFGLTLGYGAAHLLGYELIFPEGKYSHKTHSAWSQAVDKNTLTLGTPTHFLDLLTVDVEKTTTYSCIIGGAKVKKSLWMSCRDQLNIEQPSIGYGATEASPGITHLHPGDEPEMDGEIGHKLKHVKMTTGDSGLTFSGPNLCYGILENGEWNFPKEYQLPDIIKPKEDSDKYVYVTRANWFLNRGGEKFSLEKIEKLIFDDLNIETLACALPDDRLGEELGLLVLESQQNSEQIKQQVLSKLKEKTLRSFPENNIKFVKEWPYNASMKKDRLKAKGLFDN